MSKFEAMVENLLEGSLTRMLRGQLQPVEIAKRLQRAMESSKAISVGRVFVANEYLVHLNRSDYQRLEPVRGTLEREFAEYLATVAREQRLSLIKKPVVRLAPRANLPTRQVLVEARLSEQPQEPAALPAEAPPIDIGQTSKFDSKQVKRALATPAIEKASLIATSGPSTGLRSNVNNAVTTLGRGLGNDIVIDDPRVSRQHAELRYSGGKLLIADLKSTNGTWVNGQRVDGKVLVNGDRISLGGIEFTVELGLGAGGPNQGAGGPEMAEGVKGSGD